MHAVMHRNSMQRNCHEFRLPFCSLLSDGRPAQDAIVLVMSLLLPRLYDCCLFALRRSELQEQTPGDTSSPLASPEWHEEHPPAFRARFFARVTVVTRSLVPHFR
eukprot:9492534-Pyramimonas_sp.AAC.2